MDALGRGLLKEFPNPDRTGCPGSEVLKKIASHKMALTEAEKWLGHLTSCSPCYRDFTHFQAAYRRSRARALLAIAASILVLACAAGWAVFLRQKPPMVAQTAVLDLRNYSIPRGTEPIPGEPPLEVARNVSRLEIYLPLGSAEGTYELRITDPAGNFVFSGSGRAKVKEGMTSLRLDVKLSSASSGMYVLQLRKIGSGWTLYPLQVR